MSGIHILLVEDSDDDALLIVTHLRRAGLELSYDRVQSAQGVRDALASRPPDIMICDYSLPSFSAQDALTLLHGSGLDVPFILVSGAVGEETAAAVMKAGASDVILKHRLTRLVPAVQRELRDAQGRAERRRAEAALRESEERFRLLAEHVQDIVFRYRLRPEPGLEYVSPAVADLTGYTPAELYADPALVLAMVEPDDRAAFEAAWRSPASSPLVLRWRRRDGDLVWIEQRAVGVRGEDGRVAAVEGIMRDVTGQVLADRDRARLDRELRQAERLDSLGRLAGGIAHDFNNLLAVIMTYAGDVTDALPADHPIQPDVRKISQSAERAATLTRQLLIFSRLEPSQPETLDLNTVVTDIEHLLRRTIGEDIEFLTILERGLRPVTIDRSKIEQVIMNLVVNARAAMPQGGRLCVQTANVAPETGAPQVSLTVTDTGCGMTPEVSQRAFEPFFTTKGPGQGTGLGLATAYGVVKEAGGEIGLHSAPGKGTTLRVLLPVAANDVTDAVVAAPRAPHGAGQSILVVEDDDDVRDVVTRALARADYQVVAAATPKDALEICANHLVHVDAMLTDVVMPEMSGIQLAERVGRLRPGLPILLMSGYTAGTLPGGPEPSIDLPLLRKPFSAATLLQHIRDLLR